MKEEFYKDIEKLMKQGSTFNKETLKKIKNFLEEQQKKDQGIEDCLKSLTQEIEEYSKDFIHQKEQFVSGLSSCIYLPSSNGSYSITIFGGKTRYDEEGVLVDEKTIFDLASITKLYTFLLTLKLMEQGYLKKEDQIKKLDCRFSELGDYTVEDILKMAGTILTKERVDVANTETEACQILQSTFISDPDRSYNHYTDIGLIVLSKVIEKIVSEKQGKTMNFDEIMKTYLLTPYGLEETMFYPDKNRYLISGNGNKEGLVHDPKARILGGAVGSAGLFATSKGITHLANHLFQVSNVKESLLAGKKIYPNSNKGYAGIYQKHPLGFAKTFVPNEFATGSFAHQGFTGALAVFDPINKLHNHILVNAIEEGAAKKRTGFMKAFTLYQVMITEVTLKAYFLKQYYQRIGYNKDVEIKRFVR